MDELAQYHSGDATATPVGVHNVFNQDPTREHSTSRPNSESSAHLFRSPGIAQQRRPPSSHRGSICGSRQRPTTLTASRSRSSARGDRSTRYVTIPHAAGQASAGRTTLVAQQATDQRLYAMKPQRRREVWQFVHLAADPIYWHLPDQELKNEHAAYAFCLKCKKSVSYGQRSNKVLEHMTNYHKRKMKDFIEEQAASKDGATRDLSEAFAEAAQPPKKRATRRLTPDEKKRVNRLLAQWVARHFRPIRIVEDAGFIEFVQFITLELGHIEMALPKRTQLRAEIVALAGDLRERVGKVISEGCYYYSITSDIWTARNARSYISFTLHYVNAKLYPVNWTLEVRELPGIHDSGAIVDALETIMLAWSLPIERCTKFVRDAGSNMVRAAAELGVSHMSCIAHAVHLVVSGLLIKPKSRSRPGQCESAGLSCEELGDSFAGNESYDDLLQREQETLRGLQDLAVDEMDAYLDETFTRLELSEMDAVRKVVQGFRSLAVYFRKSPKARHRLSKIQIEALKTAPHGTLNLIVDCPTRWNSCLDMINRFIDLKPALQSFFGYLGTSLGRKEFKDVKRTLFQPKNADWLIVTCLKALLAPFGSATRYLSGQAYPTLPLVLPALAGIRRRLANRDLFDRAVSMAGEELYVEETVQMLQECRKRVLVLFDKRFAALEDSELSWVSFLDPSVARKMSHLTAATRPAACAAIVKACVVMAKQFEHDNAEASTPENQPSPEPVPDDDGDVGHDMFGDDEVERSAADLEHACSDEFTQYLAEGHSIKTADDPFDWWRVHQHKYPHLCRLARKWLGVVATSVPSERAFSTSGNTVTVKRSSLAPDMVRDLVFVSENWKI